MGSPDSHSMVTVKRLEFPPDDPGTPPHKHSGPRAGPLSCARIGYLNGDAGTVASWPVGVTYLVPGEQLTYPRRCKIEVSAGNGKQLTG